MHPVNQTIPAPVHLTPPSLIETNLNEARKASSPLPCKSLIWYADMWFNLKDDPHFDLKISDEVKRQLYFAATAHRNASGIIQKGDFSSDHLQIDELVLLYRIINSYYLKWDGPEKNVMFEHLFMMEKRFNELCRYPRNKENAVQALRNQNDPELDLIMATLSSNDFVISVMIRNLSDWVRQSLNVNRALAARRIIECYVKQAPILDLRYLALDELPNTIENLTHLRSIYLNGNQIVFNNYSLASLYNLEVFFLYETTDPRFLEMQRELNTWIRQAIITEDDYRVDEYNYGSNEYKRRIRSSFDIINHYLDRDPRRALDLTSVRSSLPNCIFMLTNLHTLKLGLNGSPFVIFPPGIRQLTNLKSLVFQMTPLETVPTWIGELINLEELAIQNSVGLNALPDEIGNLRKLINLRIKNNRLTEIPRAFARLPATCTIEAEGNRLTLEAIQTFQTAIADARADNPLNGPIFLFSIYEAQAPRASALAAQGRPQTLAESITSFLTDLQMAFPKATHEVFWANRLNDRFPQAGNPMAHLTFYQTLLTHKDRDYLTEFLKKLRNTRDFSEYRTRSNVLTRVDHILEGAATNAAFRDELFICLRDANDTCGDRVTLSLNKIDILWRIHCLGPQLTLEGLKDLVVGRWRVVKLEEIAYQKIAQKKLGDHIETILFYQVKLKDRLDLPVITEGMLYGGMSGITSIELEEAAVSVLKTTTEQEDVIKILLEQESWKNRERMENPWLLRLKSLYKPEFDAITNELNEKLQDVDMQKETMTDGLYQKSLNHILETLNKRIEDKLTVLTREFVFLSYTKK